MLIEFKNIDVNDDLVAVGSFYASDDSEGTFACCLLEYDFKTRELEWAYTDMSKRETLPDEDEITNCIGSRLDDIADSIPEYLARAI